MNKLKLSLVALVLLIANIANAQIINLFAGSGFGSLGDGGSATAARLNVPLHGRPDGAGNVNIADINNNRVRQVNSAGIITTIAGNGFAVHSGDGSQATAAGVSHPQSMVADHAGNLYIAEGGNTDTFSWIRKIDPSGIITTIGGNGSKAYGGDGGPATSAGFNFITDIVLDVIGNLYVCDQSHNRIRKIDTSGIVTTVVGNGIGGYNGEGMPATDAQINYPSCLTFDAAGNMYFGDLNNNRIRKVSTSGTISTFVGNGSWVYSGDGGQATDAGITNPYGIAVDAAGNMYFTDSYFGYVRKVNTAGIVSTIAGVGTHGGAGDGGPAIAAQLYVPWGLDMDAAGNIYIADQDLSNVRVIGTTSLATTNVYPGKYAEADNNLKVWPVVNDGSFSISITSETTCPVQITITNISGQIMKELKATTNTETKIVANLPAGIYLIKAASNNASWSRKIVVRY